MFGALRLVAHAVPSRHQQRADVSHLPDALGGRRRLVLSDLPRSGRPAYPGGQVAQGAPDLPPEEFAVPHEVVPGRGLVL
eukprot:4083056-Alexandrium_andersonii.AAC.1